MSLFEKHQQLLEAAVVALHERTFYAAFPENPSPKIYGETADADGLAQYDNALGKRFVGLLQDETSTWKGEETSPYTQKPLGITYPIYAANDLVAKAKSVQKSWAKADYRQRAGILVESLMRMKLRFFEIAHATLHTTGQGYMMAFQASGPHAADRALEAIASGYEELGRFPSTMLWDKPMGKFNIQLNKTWRAVPKGINLVVGCSTFPTWNTVPGMYAGLITGNTVIIKPHPKAVLPIAIVVAELQAVLKENGFDPAICQLAADTSDALITKTLAENPEVKMIDYTGGTTFGSYLEALPNKVVFTEKAGVNSIILDSVADLDAALANLAFSVSLYSGQMCTAPQNFYIPASGINTPQGKVSFEEVAEKFAAQVRGLAENPKAAPFVLGAIQNPATTERIKNMNASSAKVVLSSGDLVNPQYPDARTATPLIVTVNASDKAIYSQELFGPIVLLIATKDTAESVALAKEMAMSHGAISCGAYTTDRAVQEHIMDEMAEACTPVSFNLTGGIYVNQNAAFSDFHVTGGNPAGNASFTNPEYVIKRFTWVGFREPAAV